MNTRNATLMTLAVTALVTIALAQVAAAIDHPVINNYFPLHENNRWVYVKDIQGIGHPTRSPYPMEEVKVLDTRRVEGIEVFTVSNYIFQLGSSTTEFATSLDGPVIELFGNEMGPWYEFESGQSINLPPFANDCIHGSAGAVATRRVIDTPAGFFEDCLQITYTNVPCSEKGLVSETFAPSIGLVQRQIRNEQGGIDTWSLKWARVNGYVFTGPTAGPRSERDALTAPAVEASWGKIKSLYND